MVYIYNRGFIKLEDMYPTLLYIFSFVHLYLIVYCIQENKILVPTACDNLK